MTIGEDDAFSRKCFVQESGSTDEIQMVREMY